MKTSSDLSLPSPVGEIWVRSEAGAVTALGWGARGVQSNDVLLVETARQLEEYFAGTRRKFEIPMEHGQTGLAARVLAAISAIPFGETRTYGDIAKDLDAPPQAIGQACGANPLPVLIPCHRVLAAGGLGGYSGAGGVETKVALLRLEGAAGLLI